MKASPPRRHRRRIARDPEPVGDRVQATAQAESTSRTTPVASQRSAYRSRRRRLRIARATSRSRIDATRPRSRRREAGESLDSVTRRRVRLTRARRARRGSPDGFTAPPRSGRRAAGRCRRRRERHLDRVVERAEGGDRRLAGLAAAHLHLHLENAQAVADDHHRSLDLRVVVRVVGGEQADQRVHRLEAGGRVGQLLPRQERDEPRKPANPGAAGERRLVVAVPVREAGRR